MYFLMFYTMYRRCNLSRTHRVCAKIGLEGRILPFIKTSRNDQRKNILKLNVFLNKYVQRILSTFSLRGRGCLNERYMVWNMTNKKKMYILGCVKKWWVFCSKMSKYTETLFLLFWNVLFYDRNGNKWKISSDTSFWRFTGQRKWCGTIGDFLFFQPF